MRTCTRDVVRMLATLRHAAHCTALHAAKAEEVLRSTHEEVHEITDEEEKRTPVSNDSSHRRVH